MDNSEGLSIGGYEKDVTQRVSGFLKQKLPEALFSAVLEHLQNVIKQSVFPAAVGENKIRNNPFSPPQSGKTK